MTTVQFQLGGTLKFITDEPSPAGAFITLRYDGFTITARADQMAYKLPNDKAVKVQVSYVDAKGNPAAVDGDVTWDTSDATIATVTAETGDSTIATVIPADKVGQVQINATADADLGAGVTTLVTTMDVEVLAGQAVAGTISPVGEPIPIP
jgi:uncharacterized Zn-binding protein involved in type VI secretion